MRKMSFKRQFTSDLLELEIFIYNIIIRGVREPEISGSGRNTKFLRDRDEYSKMSRVSNLSGFSKEPRVSKKSGISKELGFVKGTSLNNSLKPTPSIVSKSRRSRTIIRAMPSVISFGLTIFRVSFAIFSSSHTLLKLQYLLLLKINGFTI